MPTATLENKTELVQHAINNRLNTLMLGLGYLEETSGDDARMVVQSLKLELRDLQKLIDRMKTDGC